MSTVTDSTTTDAASFWNTSAFADDVDDLIPEDSLFDGKRDIIVKLLYAFSSVGIFGNITAVVVFLSGAHLRRKPINIFFVHQSLIDICACLFTIIEEVIAEFGINGIITCHLFISKTCSAVALYTSTYNLTMLTIERHFAIVKPLQYNTDKVMARMPILFIGEWFFIIVVFLFAPITTVYQNGVCLVIFRLAGTILIDMMSPYLFTVAIVIPLVVMSICYWRMIRALFKSSASFDNTNPNAVKLRAAQVNLFQTCLIMLVVFLGCWLTSQSAMLLYIVGRYPNLGNDHYSIGRLMTLMNSAVNPYIYAIRYDDFKQQMKHLVGIKVIPENRNNFKRAISTVS